MKNRKQNIVRFAPLLLLLLPLIGNQISEEVNWSVGDFLVMGILLLVFGFALSYAIDSVKTKTLRIIAVVLILILLLIWIELAVGIFDSPFAGN